MDDDERDDTGLGTLAAWQLGRWSAESDFDHDRLIERLTGRSPVARADYDHACSMNAQLVQANRQHVADLAYLRDHVEKWRVAYEQLKARTAKAESDLKAAKTETAILAEKYKDHVAFLKKDIIFYMKAYRKITGTTGEDVVDPS